MVFENRLPKHNYFHVLGELMRDGLVVGGGGGGGGVYPDRGYYMLYYM